MQILASVNCKGYRTEGVFFQSSEHNTIGIISLEPNLVLAHEKNSIRLFSEMFSKELNRDHSLFETLQKAQPEFLHLLEQKYGETIDGTPKYMREAYSFVFVRVKKNEAEYIQTGDSMLFFGNEEYARAITTDKKDLYMIRIKSEIQRIKKYNYPFVEEILFEDFSQVQELSNTPFGYPVFDGTQESLSTIEQGVVEIKKNENLLLLSGGMKDDFCHLSKKPWDSSAIMAYQHKPTTLSSFLETVQGMEYKDDFEKRVFIRDKVALMIDAN